ncbi:MAG: sulfite exporter TauE/SafE family protein [Candidatus Caldarchaeum sp.]
MVNLLYVVFISFIAGLVGSVTGLGGASITTPLLTLVGVPIKYAIAAGIVSIIATSSGSAASYVRGGLSNVRAAMFLEMFTIVGGIIGAIITVYIVPRLLYFFFAAFLLTSFIGLRRHLGEEIPSNVKQDKAARWLGLSGSYYDRRLGKEVTYKLTKPLEAGAGMFIAGLAAGMLGIGAGAFKVAVHELILRMPSKVSSATSTFIIGMTALAGASIYFGSGLLYLTLAAPMVVGTTIGAMVGSRLLNRISNRGTRIFFLVVVLYLIVQMLLKGLLE